MTKYQENIVPASQQNDANVFLHDNKEAKVRIIFAGNSITKHAPKAEIGWLNDCGMAASSVDNDYVHLVVKKIADKYDKNVAFCIAQVADYERGFFDMTPEKLYKKAKDFNANVIIHFYGANVNKEYDVMENPLKKFAVAYEDMRNYLANKNAKSYHSMGFYIRPVLEEAKKAVAKKYNEVYIDIDDIRTLDETHGLFNHPSDKGMEMLAERFFSVIEDYVRELVSQN